MTVNHNGAGHLQPALEALSAQTYRDFELIVVDNASTDGSPELVERCFPQARLLRSDRNLGFAGGNNLGIRQARGRYLALVNNDTEAEPDWLLHLVRELESDDAIAAAGPKILFLRPFLALELTVAGGEAGVLLDEESAFAACAYRKPIFRRGFAEPRDHQGRRARRIAGAAVVFLPVEDAGAPARLRLGLAGERAGTDGQVTARVGGGPSAELAVVGAHWAEHDIEVPAAAVREGSFEVINNAGSFLGERGEAGDRGIHEPDRGQYDRPEDVPALCGAAMLLRRRALAEVGLFDPSFFMYYEDSDLCWRLRARGHRLRYQPASVVRHHHAAASVEWSPLFIFHVARNRILMLAKNASLGVFLRAWAGELRYAARLLLRRLGGDAGSGPLLALRLRVQASLMVRLPAALARRWRLLRHPLPGAGTG